MDRRSIPQTLRNFENEDSHTYYDVDLLPHSRSQGSWQLFFDGWIKVDYITVALKSFSSGPSAPPKPHYQNIVIGEGAATKFLPYVQGYPVREDDVESLSLRGAGNLIQIIEVKVELQNGRRISLRQFPAQIYPGQELEARLPERSSVRQIWVTATTLNPLGPVGTYQISVKTAY
jgi:hypothetical protein